MIPVAVTFIEFRKPFDLVHHATVMKAINLSVVTWLAAFLFHRS